MLVESVNVSFDLAKTRKAVQQILQEWETNNGQISMTHTLDADTTYDKLYEATGSLYDFDKREFMHKECDFTVFNDVFKNTYLYDIYKALPNIGRFRIMVMDGPKCYTIHNDFTKRYHYVLYTDPRCYFVFPEENEISHIPCDGNVYLVDTTKQHTFVNGSRGRRIHLVLDALDTYIK